MKIFRNWKNIYLDQLVINLMIGLYFLFYYDISSIANLKSMTTVEDGICTLIVLIALIFNIVKIKNQTINFWLNWLNIIAIPFIFIYFLSEETNILGDDIAQAHNLIQIIYLILSIVLFIPFTEIELKKVKSPIGKIISFICFFLNLTTFSQPTVLTKIMPVLNWLATSRIFNAVAFLISVKIILGQRLNLKWRKNTNFQIWVVLLLVALGIWFDFFAQFTSNAHNLSEALWNWNSFFNSTSFTYFNFNYQNIFPSLEAGIAEESMRCLDLVLLLAIFKNSKNRLLLAVLCSSLIFALMHYAHLLDPGQNLYRVSLQVIYTFGFGSFIAVTYLYTGQFWLSVLLHFLSDYLAYSTTLIARTDTGFLSNYGNGLVESLFIALFPLLITTFMFFGKRKKNMMTNAGLLSGEI